MSYVSYATTKTIRVHICGMPTDVFKKNVAKDEPSKSKYSNLAVPG